MKINFAGDKLWLTDSKTGDYIPTLMISLACCF